MFLTCLSIWVNVHHLLWEAKAPAFFSHDMMMRFYSRAEYIWSVKKLLFGDTLNNCNVFFLQ